MRVAKKSDFEAHDLPAKRRTIALNRTFLPNEMQRIQAGLVPEMMDDRWFIYWHNDELYFHRSWTGFCIYIVRFVTEGNACNAYRMIEADLNRDTEQYSETSDAHDAKLISWLIDVVLLEKSAEFPSDESGSE